MTLWVVRTVAFYGGSSEHIHGPFASSDDAEEWLSRNRPKMGTFSYAPQIMPLSSTEDVE